jgi:hypothetical protein
MYKQLWMLEATSEPVRDMRLERPSKLEHYLPSSSLHFRTLGVGNRHGPNLIAGCLTSRSHGAFPQRPETRPCPKAVYPPASVPLWMMRMKDEVESV